MKNMHYFSLMCKHIATLGTVGYLSFPGTKASFFGVYMCILLKKYALWSNVTELTLLLYFAAICAIIIFFGLKYFPFAKDPAQIVLDEVVGMCCSFYMIPMTFSSIVWGFLIFRFFDIVKPFGINYLEHLPGVFGILLDDIVAGMFTCITLSIIYS